MTRKHAAPNSYVKKETMLISVFIALVVGFLGGIIFNIYQSQSGARVQTQTNVTQNAAGKDSERIAALKAEASKNPENADAWIQMGNIYFDENQFSDAIAAYEKALEIQPKNADVRTDLGIMYRRSGNPKKAVEQFDMAIQADPKHETALFDKGIVLMHDLNDREGAIRTWERLVELNPFAKAPNGQPMVGLIAKLKQAKPQ